MPPGSAPITSSPTRTDITPVPDDAVLSPVRSDDLPYLYALAAVAPENWPRVCRRGLPAPHEFEVALWHGVTALFTIRDAPQEPATGAASIHDLDLTNGLAWLDIVLDPNGGADLRSGQIADQLVSHAFRSWPLRKVYAAHHGYQAPPLSRTRFGYVEEVRLSSFVLFDGHRWDRVIGSVTRADWSAEASRGDT